MSSTAAPSVTASPVAPGSSSEGSTRVHSYSLQYLALLGVLVGVLMVLAVRRYRQDPSKRRRFLLVGDHWPRSAKEGAAMIVLMFFMVPCAIFFTSGVFGGVLAAAEDWSWTTGFDYVVSNVAGLSSPLTSVSPSSTFGIFLDVIVSVWAMLLANSFMGVTANMGCVQRLISSMPGSTIAFVRYTFVYVPAVLLALSLFVGLVLAGLEEWSPLTGFLFSVSALCGLANPLTSVSPVTTAGAFVELIGVLAELTLGGAIVGIVSAHPLCNRLICLLEGPANLVHALQVSAERIRQAEYEHNDLSWEEKFEIFEEQVVSAAEATIQGESLNAESELPEHAPEVMPDKIMVHQSQVPQGTVGLPTWQCTWPSGCGIRLQPLYKAERRTEPGPMDGEVFQVSHCRTGADGILHLRLADGRGWLPTTNPLGELMCVHYDTSSIGPWQVHAQHVDGVCVRSECGSSAAVLRVMLPGVTFQARQEGNWLALADGQGFVRMRRFDGIFLVQRVDASVDRSQLPHSKSQLSHFHVCVARSQDVSLGFQARSAEEGAHLVIEQVLGGSFAGWNEANPHRAVRAGDRIIELNQRHDAQAMLAEIDSALMLHMLIERDEPACLEEVATALPASSTQLVHTSLRMLSVQPGGNAYRAQNEQGTLVEVEIDWSLLSGPDVGDDIHAETEITAGESAQSSEQVQPPYSESLAIDRAAPDALLAAERSEAQRRLVESEARVVEAQLIAEEANRRAAEAEARAVNGELAQRIATEANKRTAEAEARAAKAESLLQEADLFRTLDADGPQTETSRGEPDAPPPTAPTLWRPPGGSRQGRDDSAQLPQQSTDAGLVVMPGESSDSKRPEPRFIKNRSCIGNAFCWDTSDRVSRTSGGNGNPVLSPPGRI